MTATSHEALIDRSTVEELQQAMGEEAFADIAATFYDQVSQLMEQFAAAAQAADLRKAGHLAHEMIGLAGTMGAPRLTDVARQAMALCRSEQSGALPDIAEVISRTGAETLEAFRAYA